MPYAKRKTLPGYPKEFTFETREQVDAYFSGKRIECLLCGSEFKSLDLHLRAVHEITVDQYREKYGLPYLRGLCCEETHNQMSKRSTEFFLKNQERQMGYLRLAKETQADGNPQRKKPDFWKSERTKYDRSHYEEFILRVLSGRKATEVEKDSDMPSITHLYGYMEKDPEFSARYNGEVRPELRKRNVDRASTPRVQDEHRREQIKHVYLSPEEKAVLDEFLRKSGHANLSQAVRAMIAGG